MTQYIIRRKSERAFWCDDDCEPNDVKEIFVPEHKPTDTGLIDANGDAIMRAPNPMGFVW